jgi:WhiB family redox-sensing transcriptional regulator
MSITALIEQFDVPLLPGAACVGHDPDLWQRPDGAMGYQPRRDEAAARAICGRCPSREACLAYALDPDVEVYGTWGGKTETEIAKLRAENAPPAPPAAAAPTPQCGGCGRDRSRRATTVIPPWGYFCAGCNRARRRARDAYTRTRKEPPA